jgi:hypothetical protein
VKKLMMPFAVGLAIGLAATSVFFGFVKGGSPSLTESLSAAVADSAHAAEGGEAHGDSAAHAPADSGVHVLPDSLGAHALVPAGGVKVADTTAVGPGSHTPADNISISPAAVSGSSSSPSASPSGPSMETAQLAKLFASMQPREAARVLDKMDDFEVQVILNQLGNREAAAILGNLPPERAAMISRSVIRGERSSN